MSSAHKRAVSLMISYVLLVVIGIAISIFVYAYLKNYLPLNQRECQIDIKIAVTDASCLVVQKDISFTIENRGLFNVSGLFVRFDKPNKRIKTQLNPEDEFLDKPLAPQESITLNYANVTNPAIFDEAYELQIEPALLIDGFLVPCKDSIITYPIECSII